MTRKHDKTRNMICVHKSHKTLVVLMILWLALATATQPIHAAVEIEAVHFENYHDPAGPEVPIVPPTMRLLGQLGGAVNALAVQGNTAYAGVGPRLLVFDVTNPQQPALLGQTPAFADIVQDVAAAGTRIYVATGDSGLRIVDVSTPTRPVEVGAFATPGFASGVATFGHYAAVADRQNGLLIVDVISPASPTLIGSLATPGLALDIAVTSGTSGAGPTLGLLAIGEGLAVVGLSDPANPVAEGFFDSPGFAESVAVADTLAYLADGDSGLQIVDFADPAHPAAVGSVNTPGYAIDVAVAGTESYVADGDGGLRIVDVSNPASPALSGVLDTHDLRPNSRLGRWPRLLCREQRWAASRRCF